MVKRETYKVIKYKGKSKDEHRLVMEKHLNRELKYNEVIHHIDEDKKNNHIENLRLMTRSEHSKLHAKKAKTITINCANCGKKITIREKYYNFKKQNQKKFFCSQFCVGTFYKSEKYNKKLIITEYEKGLTGYGIAKKYKLNKQTVYKYINKYKGLCFNQV